jgi:hypothetical protein
LTVKVTPDEDVEGLFLRLIDSANTTALEVVDLGVVLTTRDLIDHDKSVPIQ